MLRTNLTQGTDHDTTLQGGRKKTPARSEAQEIAKLNDNMRKAGSFPNTYLPLELANRGMPFVKKLLASVKAWTAPTDADETDAERSWGSVEVGGMEVAWSIDYYELNGEDPVSDPSDAEKTPRTMTLEKA